MRRFPKTRDDGTFKVRVRFSAPPKKDLASIQRWLADWVQTHGEWVFFGKTHRFSEYFRETPRAILGDAGELCLVFHGVSPDRGLWRDWYARLGKDTVEAFPEIGELITVENCD
jgi:hypothetical protein